MNKIFYSIHFVSTAAVEEEKETFLSLRSEKKLRLNPLLILGAVFFLSSMIMKANSPNRLLVLPLATATFMMMAGIWRLSASGRVVFDKTENKVFCIYKHLGYWQKIYTYSLPSIDEVSISESRLNIIRDDGLEIIISRLNPQNRGAGKHATDKISSFLGIKKTEE